MHLTDIRVLAKISKARAFLDHAELSGEIEPDVTVSLAASAAVNASDAILLLRGVSNLADENHGRAVSALRKMGQGQAARHLAGALANKTKAQYSTNRCSVREAQESLKHAQRIMTEAEVVSAKEGALSES